MSIFTAAETLRILQDDLGHPNTDVLDAEEGPGVLKRALARAARRRGATLVVLFIQDDALPSWLPEAPEPHVLEVTEGLLVTFLVPGRSAAGPRTRRPWTTPDAAPVSTAVEDDLEELLLRPILSAVEWDTPLEVPEPATPAERLLGRHGLLVHDGERFRPTVAAVVLTASRPSRFVPGCRLEGRVEGNALSHFAPLLRLRRELGAATGLDQELASGLVTHAFLHRDWTSPEPVSLVVQGQDVVLRFSGTLGETANPLLRHLFVALGWIPKKGRALDRVDSHLEAHGLPPVSLVQEGEEVVLRARVRRRHKPARHRLPQTTRHHPPSPRAEQQTAISRPPTTRQTTRRPPARPPAPEPEPVVEVQPEEEPLVDDLVEPESPPVAHAEPVEPEPSLLPPPFLDLRAPQDRRDRALATLEVMGEATTRELADALGCSRPVAGKVLKDLVDRGLVRRLTATSRSPYQRYASTSIGHQRAR